MKRRTFVTGAAASAATCMCGGHAFAQATKMPPSKVLNTKASPIISATKKSFCDFVAPAQHTGGIVPHSYTTKGAGRGKSALTWSFTGAVPGMASSAAVVSVLSQAFNLWRGPVPALSFTQTNGAADIAISVAALGAPTAAGQTLASTAPSGATIRINNQATFAANAAAAKAGQTSLLNVITHEIGHAVGLLHATTPNSIMYAFANSQEALQPDDTAAIKALYGWRPQTKLVGGTEAPPAICACGNTLALVWRGQGNNHNLWISTSTDGKNWTPQRSFNDVGTIASPALAWDGSRLWMVWRGTGDDQGIYFKTSKDFFVRDNPGQTNVKGVGSSTGPRIAMIGGKPTMFWKGVNKDHAIYFSQFDGGQWRPQASVPGIGSEESPAICQDLGGGARLLWRGIGDDHVLWSTASAANLTGWQAQKQMTWTVPGNGGKPATSGTAASLGGPALVQVGNVIQAAWRGGKNDQGLWFTQLATDNISGTNVTQWSGQSNLLGVGSSTGPSITAFKGNLFMAWKGIDGDSGIYMSSL